MICPIRQAALNWPSRPVFVSDEESISYQAFDHLINYHVHLWSNQIQTGDYIGLRATNSIDTAVAIWAIFRLGAVAVLMSPKWPASYLKTRFADLPPVTLFDSSIYHHERLHHGPAEINPDQPATLIWTSGSSGQAKGVVHTVNHHIASATASQSKIPLTETDQWDWSLPPWHVSGLSILFRTALAGAAVRLPGSLPDTNHLVRSMVLTQFKTYLDTFSPKPKAILLGGSPFPAHLIQLGLNRELPLFFSYGSTEMASQICTASPTKLGQNPTSVGQPLPGQVVSISKREIYVKGNSLFLGVQTAGGITKECNADGWFKTQDLGQLDDAGNLTVTGRADAQFFSGGENISPEEIESVLLAHPQIDQVVVVPKPDAEWGEIGVAFIKSRLDSFEALFDYMDRHLPAYKHPKQLLVWPKTISQGLKINREDFKQYLSVYA